MTDLEKAKIELDLESELYSIHSKKLKEAQLQYIIEITKELYSKFPYKYFIWEDYCYESANSNYEIVIDSEIEDDLLDKLEDYCEDNYNIFILSNHMLTSPIDFTKTSFKIGYE